MPSILPSYEYDIFISYRQKDNRSDQWVTHFINALQEEIDATFKEDISIYFDSNPHDGLHETHDVDGSLKEKVKCLIFIPIVSRTYCDPNAFAWQKEFRPFLEFASQDEFGLDIKLQGGNVAKRVLPIRIHELPSADRKLIEDELQGPLRSIDFIYQSAGVNRPLTPDDERDLNVQKTFYKDQLNKAANAIHDIITAMQLGEEFSLQHTVSEDRPQLSAEKVSTITKRKTEIKPPRFNRTSRLRLLNALFLIVAAVFAILYFSSSQESDKQSISASILPPRKLDFTSDFDVSPDGKLLAFVATDSLGNNMMWIRPIEALSAQPLQGTDGADFPFWSPDSQYIGFFADGKLKKISASGGPVLTLCEAGTGRGGSWSPTGTIIFGAVGSPIYKVKDTGGTPQIVMRLDSARNERSQRFPSFLPDGHHFLYTSQSNRAQDDAIFLASLDSTISPKLLVNASSSGRYADGHLLYGYQETLMARPFDIERRLLEDDVFPIAEGVDIIPAIQYASFSVSNNGIIVYQQSTEQIRYSLSWYDRQGTRLRTVPSKTVMLEVVISPNASKVAVSQVINGFFDIMIYDVDRSVWNRFTFDEGEERWPVWSSDGNTIVYSSNRDRSWDLYQRKTTGSGIEEIVLSLPQDISILSLSADGKYLAYTTRQEANYDIWIRPMKEKDQDSIEQEKPFVFLESDFIEIHPSFSPDGRWIAYQSDESGRDEIYLRPFPGPGAKRQISVNGGTRPQWSGNGEELFYLSPDNTIFVQEIDWNSATLFAGQPEALFSIIPTGGPYANPYDVSPDGQYFVISETNEVGTSQPFVIMLNKLKNIKKNSDRD